MVELQADVDLGSLTTLRLPARAKRFVRAESHAQLCQLLLEHGDISRPLLLLGGGSNLILSGRFDGLCLQIASRGIKSEPLDNDRVRVCAQAGENWHRFVEYCLDNGWHGLENLALIPGTVGAAPIQNIGAYGVEVKDFLHHVEVWDRKQAKRIQLSCAQCRFGYRESLFKSGEPGRYVVLSVSFDLLTHYRPKLGYAGLADHPGTASDPRALFDAVVELRRAKLPDPEQLPNAGSFFKNPVVSLKQFEQLKSEYPQLVAYPDSQGMKLAAGWLIDRAGWKGYRDGAVGVHQHQALVLVNYGGADATQLLALAAEIQADVATRFGVALEIEPRTV